MYQTYTSWYMRDDLTYVVGTYQNEHAQIHSNYPHKNRFQLQNKISGFRSVY